MHPLHMIGIATGTEGRQTQIRIDGVPLKGVTAIDIRIGLEGPPELTVTMFAEVDYQGDHAVTFKRETVQTVCRECGRTEEHPTFRGRP